MAITIERLFEKIFRHPDLVARPPVLLDIGASGSLPAHWQHISRYATCIAFDADDREMDFIDNKAKNFARLHVINKIVTYDDVDTADFYLTASPFCSSLLQPDNESLADWAFADLFKVEKKIKLPATSLQKALKSLGVDYVDWFKSDTQGLDLHLFKNMGETRSCAIVADFEPGFIDAYKGEDKIKDLLAYMAGMPFWLCGFATGGAQRLNAGNLGNTFTPAEIERLKHVTQDAAIYAEVTYVNNFKDAQMQTARYYLLGAAFSIILKQYGFAAELAVNGFKLTKDELFNELLAYIKQVTRKVTIGELLTKPALLKKKIINQVIYRLQKLQ